MFKALDTELDQHVVSLDPLWDEQVEMLRGWGRADRLVCPVCRQAVLLRAGEIVRRHFAHKDQSQCPLSHESAEVLAGRAALYVWLMTKFSGGVTLEKQFEANPEEDYQLPRGVDCWVERPGKRSLAYWLVGGKIGPEDRIRIPGFIETRGAALNWVFLPREARRGRSPGRVVLSPTERDLLTRSELDAVYGGSDCSAGSLHCLDPESRVLTTYRALLCIESPQFYEGQEVTTELSRVLVIPKTGEFVHPGEYERLKVVREELRRQEEADGKAQADAARRQTQRAAAAQAAAARAVTDVLPSGSPAADRGRASAKVFDILAARASRPNRPETPAAIEEPEGTCTLCGKRTRDWVVFDTKTAECKCRDCLRKQDNDRHGKSG